MATEFSGASDLPVLVLRRQVAFPRVVVRVLVGRKRSLALLKYLQKQGKVGQKQPSFAAVAVRERPGDGSDGPDEAEETFDVGVAARVLRITRHSQSRNTYLVLLQGVTRVKVGALRADDGGFYTADVNPLPRSVSFAKSDGDTKPLADNLRQVAEEMMDMLDPSVSVLAKGNLDMSQMSVSLLADLLAAHSGIDVTTAQEVLESSDLKARVETVIAAVAKVREVMKLSNEIESSVKTEMSKSQREFLLRQQMKAIEKELGDSGGQDEADELDELAAKLEKALPFMSEEARVSAQREMKRLKKIPPSSMEHSMLLNWVEWMVDLPWSETTQDMLDVEKSMAQLNADHHGLDKVKDRIVEFLAVRCGTPAC